MMHSMSNMAAAKYLPSINEKTDKKRSRPLFGPKSGQMNSSPISSRNDCFAKNLNGGLDQQLEASAAWTTSSALVAPDYQPLDAFSAAEEGPGVSSWSEADDICALCIRLKEIELCNMMEETSSKDEDKYLKSIRTYSVKQMRRKQK